MWGISCLRLQCLVPTWPSSSAHCSTLSHYAAAPRRDTKPQWRLFSSRGCCSYKSSSDSCFAHLCLISRPCPFFFPPQTPYAGRFLPACVTVKPAAAAAAAEERSPGSPSMALSLPLGDNAFFPCHKADAVLWQHNAGPIRNCLPCERHTGIGPPSTVWGFLPCHSIMSTYWKGKRSGQL